MERATFSVATAFTRSEFRRVTISFGVPAGTCIPYHAATMTPGRVSPTVGNSGSAFERFSLAVAISRSFPFFAWGTTVGPVPNMSDTSPDRMAVIIGPAILEQMDTTTLLHRGDRASQDADGNLIIEVRT